MEDKDIPKTEPMPPKYLFMLPFIQLTAFMVGMYLYAIERIDIVSLLLLITSAMFLTLYLNERSHRIHLIDWIRYQIDRTDREIKKAINKETK